MATSDQMSVEERRKYLRQMQKRYQKVKPEAADFAPRLDELHQALDRAACDS